MRRNTRWERTFLLARAAAREPRLVVPEERTGLPAIDRALPVLLLFDKAVGRHWARYKIAILKDLQGDGTGRWRVRDIQSLVYWLEPASVTELVGELRDAGLLAYDRARGYYRLTSEARVVSAILDALTIPEVEPRRMIKFLAAAIDLALAAGAGPLTVFGGFASAVATLREDEQELGQLTEDGSFHALLEAADRVREHAEDMQKLLDDHETFRLQHGSDPQFRAIEHEALNMVARLGDRTARVIEALTEKAEVLMRGGARLDRGDIREFVAVTQATALAGLLDGLVKLPPFVPWLLTGSAFEYLLEKAGRSAATPPPLPKPQRLVREVPAPLPDPLEEIAEELNQLAEETSVGALVVQDSWSTSVRRHSTLMEAVSRRGCARVRLVPKEKELLGRPFHELVARRERPIQIKGPVADAEGGLWASAIDTVELSVVGEPAGVVLVENRETFDHLLPLAESRWVVLRVPGGPPAAEVELVARLAALTPNVSFYAAFDTDPAGIRIALTLEQRSGIRLDPTAMSSEILLRSERRFELSDWDRDARTQLRGRSGRFEPLRVAIEQHGFKAEQEPISDTCASCSAPARMGKPRSAPRCPGPVEVVQFAVPRSF